MSMHVDAERAERRRRGLLWMGGAVAVIILTVAIQGSLAAWTAAVITTVEKVAKPGGPHRPGDSNNTAGGTDSDGSTSGDGSDTSGDPDPSGRPQRPVALQELSASGSASCDTSTTIGSAVDCGMINKYGGTANPLHPGERRTTTVTMRNGGIQPGRLTIVAGACAKSEGAARSAGNLCDVVRLKVTCGTVKFRGTLREFGAATTPILIADQLPTGTSIACDFTVRLPRSAPANVSGMSVLQGVTWTLEA